MTVVLKKRRNQSSPLSTTEVDSNWDTIQAALNASGTGDGTVTSVSAGGLSPLFTASVATATTTPAITFAQVSQTANRVLAAPDGSNGVPVFRSLVANDLSFTMPIAKGGTNSATALVNDRVMVSSAGAIVPSSTITTVELAFLDGIAGLTNGILRKDTTSLTTGAINLASADTTGINPVSKGGTGLSFAPATPTNGQLLIGNGSGFAAATITAGSGITVTNGVGAITLASSIPTINSLAGALTIAAGTTGSDIAINSSSTTITINIPTATASARGALASADFTAFNNKIGRNFTTNNTIAFTSPATDVWYITGAATLPNITSDDVGKVLFVKNIGGANYDLTADGTDTIDGNVNTRITLHNSPQSSVMLQAFNTVQWRIIGNYGTTALG
jgi:hypothetical protein